MGEHHFAAVPTALYGIVLFCAGAASELLLRALLREQGEGSRLAAAVGKDKKGIASVVGYLIAIPSAFFAPPIAYALYIAIALMWLVPDARIEKRIRSR